MNAQQVIAELEKRISECNEAAEARFKEADNAWNVGNKERYNFLCDRGNMYYKMAHAYTDALHLVYHIDELHLLSTREE